MEIRHLWGENWGEGHEQVGGVWGTEDKESGLSEHLLENQELC